MKRQVRITAKTAIEAVVLLLVPFSVTVGTITGGLATITGGLGTIGELGNMLVLGATLAAIVAMRRFNSQNRLIHPNLIARVGDNHRASESVRKYEKIERDFSLDGDWTTKPL